MWLSHWIWWKSRWNRYWIFFYGYVRDLSSRTYFSLKRSQEYGIFWNIFKYLVSKMQTTVHELCMIKDTLWAIKCMRFLVMRNVSSSLSDLVDLQLINARTKSPVFSPWIIDPYPILTRQFWEKNKKSVLLYIRRRSAGFKNPVNNPQSWKIPFLNVKGRVPQILSSVVSAISVS